MTHPTSNSTTVTLNVNQLGLPLECVADHVRWVESQHSTPSPAFPFQRFVHSTMASHTPRTPCRYFGSRGGCRFGGNCRFSHDPTSPSETRSPTQLSQQNTPSSPTSATPRTYIRRSGDAAPRRFCDFYWNTGVCNRGFDCTFQHQENNRLRPGGANAVGEAKDGDYAANAALDFFTTDNLTEISGVGLLSAQEGTPENAHNSIKRYLGGGPLNNATDMKPLASILASVNRRNHSWVRVIPPSSPDSC